MIIGTKSNMMVLHLEHRINELEEIICPNKSHDWVKTVNDNSTQCTDDKGMSYVNINYTEHMCKKCKKIKREKTYRPA